MEIQEALGRRIKQLRLEKKLSQEKLALQADIDRTYMASVENGKRNISIRNIDKILSALNVPYTVFFDSPEFTSKEFKK